MCPCLRKNPEYLIFRAWEEGDSNPRRLSPTDLQSVPVDHLGILPTLQLLNKDNRLVGLIIFQDRLEQTCILLQGQVLLPVWQSIYRHIMLLPVLEYRIAQDHPETPPQASSQICDAVLLLP